MEYDGGAATSRDYSDGVLHIGCKITMSDASTCIPMSARILGLYLPMKVAWRLGS